MHLKSSKVIADAPLPNKALVVRGVLWSAAGAVGMQVVSFIAFMLIARALDPATFGLVALAALFVALLAVFVEQGFIQAIVQRSTIEPGHLNTAFWTNLGLSFAFAGLLIVAAGPVSGVFNQPELYNVLRVLSASLILGAFSGVQVAILQRDMRFGVLASRSLTGAIVGGVLGVSMAWKGYGVWALVAHTLAAQFVTMLGLWGATDWRPRATFSRDQLRELWGFGLNVFGSSLVNFANTRGVEFLVGVLLGRGALGLFTVSSKVQTTLTQLLVGTVSRVALATLSRMQGESDRFLRTYYTGVRLTAAVAFPSFVGVAVLAPEIAGTVFGAQWIDATPLIAILSMLGIVSTVGRYNVVAIASLGYPQYNFFLDTLNAVVTLGSVAMASSWGIEAIAFVFVARAYLLWPLRVLVLRRFVGVTFRGLASAIWGSFASASVMAAGLLSLQTLELEIPAPLRLLLLIGLGALLYIGALTILSPKTLTQGFDLAMVTFSSAITRCVSK